MPLQKWIWGNLIYMTKFSNPNFTAQQDQNPPSLNSKISMKSDQLNKPKKENDYSSFRGTEEKIELNTSAEQGINVRNITNMSGVNKKYELDEILGTASMELSSGTDFVIQEHKTDRQKGRPHFDLRVRTGDGYFSSWALPKGVPTEAGTRHLAIQTPLHDSYWSYFEGHIPKGKYGAGEVKIYDKGRMNISDISPGHKLLSFHGDKVTGKYDLINTGKQSNSMQPTWIMFKRKSL